MKENELEQIFEQVLSESIQLERFQEMSMHCKRNDGFGMLIAVGSGFKGKNGQKREHNPPHAHIWSLDKTYESRFRIDNEKLPETKEDILLVDESDLPLGKYADKIIKWAKLESSLFKGNNWEAMRQNWRNIQDAINEGLAQPWYI